MQAFVFIKREKFHRRVVSVCFSFLRFFFLSTIVTQALEQFYPADKVGGKQASCNLSEAIFISNDAVYKRFKCLAAVINNSFNKTPSNFSNRKFHFLCLFFRSGKLCSDSRQFVLFQENFCDSEYFREIPNHLRANYVNCDSSFAQSNQIKEK